MTTKPTLSYVLTTYNKLPYLKEVMKRLLENVKPDEEIVVTDGASTDGTVEYLSELYRNGKIHKFVSEPDKGEAHGFNKAILMSEGELIKIITDDDVFDYWAISMAREYMLQNMSIDMLTGYASTVSNTELMQVEPIKEFYTEFLNWKTGMQKTFYSNGLALMIRKSSLQLLGLFNNAVIYIDIEYTIRNNHFANTAFSNLCYAVRISNEKSKSVIHEKHSKQQMYDICNLYNYKIPKTWLPPVEHYINWKLKLIRKIRPIINPKKYKKQLLKIENPKSFEPNQLFLYYEKLLEEHNKAIQPEFYTKS